jgi:hypothetical protein
MLVDYQGVCESKENHWQNATLFLKHILEKNKEKNNFLQTKWRDNKCHIMAAPLTIRNYIATIS